MIITRDEHARIASIRRSLTKFKRRGLDVSGWESTFFLKIIDRVMAQVEFKKITGL